MAPVSVFVAAIERLMCRTPKRPASECKRSCRTIPHSLPVPNLTSTSRKMAKSPTAAPSAFRAASFAAKQAAYRSAGFLPVLQCLISSPLNMPSSGAQSPRASSCSTRRFSMRSIPRPTITMMSLRGLRSAGCSDAESRRDEQTLKLPSLAKEEQRNRRKHDQDKDRL
jgi:hypothetical protein